MKKLYIIAALLLSSLAVSAQCSVIVTGSTNVSCNGQCDGSATLSSVGLPSFTYLWMPGGQTVQNPSDLCPGTHTVTMTDANSCQSTATVTITEPAVLTASTTQTDPTCNGMCNGDATVTASGGTQFYTYQWDTTAQSQVTATASNLCAGEHSVEVTDANGCTTTATVSLAEPAVLAVSVSTIPTSCQACTDGSATASVSGGTPSYSYDWQPGGQTTATATNLGAGFYTVTITDAQGCSTTDTVEVMTPNGIVSAENNMNVHAFPNPVDKTLNIRFGQLPVNGKAVITLYSITGMQISSGQYAVGTEGLVQIDTEGLAPGAYLLKVRFDDAVRSFAVIRQ